MSSDRHDSRPTPLLFGAAGWLFADLLLALAVIFMVANTSPHITAPPTPTPTLTPVPPTPTPQVLVLTAIPVTVNVDFTQLEAGSQQAINSVEGQLRHAMGTNPNLTGKRVGFVLSFGGAQGVGNGVGLNAAKAVNKYVVHAVFPDAAYREFFATDLPPGQIRLDLYVFK